MPSEQHIADAEQRLRAWIRDYGHLKQKPFITDLELLLATLEHCHEECAKMVENDLITMELTPILEYRIYEEANNDEKKRVNKLHVIHSIQKALAKKIRERP